MNSLWILLQKVRIHPLFWVVAGMAVLTGYFYELITLFCIIFIHEMGHSLAAHLFSWRIHKIVILPFGGVAEMDEHGNRPLKEELFVVAAGPLQHVLLAIAAFILYQFSILSAASFDMFMEFNLMILLFNLLPIWPLDGGKLLHLIFSHYLPFLKAYRLSMMYSFIFLICLHLLVLILTPLQLSIWIVLGYLYVSLWMEWKQLHFVFMRFLLERYYGKKSELQHLKPLRVSPFEVVNDVVRKFHRGYKHSLIVAENGKELGVLDENELLFACFAENRLHAKVKDILSPY